MTSRLLAAALLALVVAASATASERRPTLGELEQEVMCPTCRTVLELSEAPIADRMRAFIRTRIAAGDRKSQIKDKLVAQFGQGVLAAPPARGFDLLAWVLPFVGLLGAAAIIGLLAWRWQRLTAATLEPAQQALPPPSPLDRALERRLDEELARFDS